MDTTLETVCAEVDEDLSTEWMSLSTRVRKLVGGLAVNATDTALAADVDVLAAETSKLCDHIERLHEDVGKLLARLECPELEDGSGRAEATEVQQEAIDIQREIHEGPPNIKDVVKALFMWRDDPAERIRDRQ